VPSPEASLGDESFAAVLAVAQLESAVPDVTSSELSAARRYVEESIAGLPDVTRWGVGIAAVITRRALDLVGGARYTSLPATVRSRVAARLFRHRVPLVSEFGTLTGSLGVVAVVESRYPDPVHS
jgi:hypothetical protein